MRVCVCVCNERGRGDLKGGRMPSQPRRLRSDQSAVAAKPRDVMRPPPFFFFPFYLAQPRHRFPMANSTQKEIQVFFLLPPILFFLESSKKQKKKKIIIIIKKETLMTRVLSSSQENGGLMEKSRPTTPNRTD